MKFNQQKFNLKNCFVKLKRLKDFEFPKKSNDTAIQLNKRDDYERKTDIRKIQMIKTEKNKINLKFIKEEKDDHLSESSNRVEIKKEIKVEDDFMDYDGEYYDQVSY